MLVYATAEDLADYRGAAPPADAAALLRAASMQVRHATRFALYRTDDDGYPSDARLREVLRDATCAQVNTWLDLGITPTSGVQSLGQSKVTSKSMGGRSVSFADDSAEVKSARRAIAEGIAPGTAAELVLANAGLLSWGPRITG